MIEYFVDNWPAFASIGVVIGALVVFGKNLAELILKWRDVLSDPTPISQAP